MLSLVVSEILKKNHFLTAEAPEGIDDSIRRKRIRLKSKINLSAYTTQRDASKISSCALVPQPDRRKIQQFAVSMHDLRIYLKNTITTLLMNSQRKKILVN